MDFSHPYDTQLADAIAADAAARARSTRRRHRVVALVVALAVFALAAALVAQVAFTEPGDRSAAAPRTAVRSEAVGVTVLRPGAQPERIAAAQPVAGASTRDSARSASHAVDASGNVAVVTFASAEASLSVGERRSAAVATARRIELFGGRVLIEGARLNARAAINGARADGEFELGSTTRVTVDGRVLGSIPPNRQVAVADAGTITLNEQAVLASAPTGDEQSGPRARVVGAIAHVRLTQAFEGLPAGTEVIIGRVDAGVRAGKVRAAGRDSTDAQPGAAPPALANPPAGFATGPGFGGIQSGSPRPGEDSLPRLPAAVRGTVAGGAPSGNLQGYVFPILGRNSYTDSWGAARASTGIPHQGTDIFADEGTPIVAVADGVLDRVGWNSIGGYRFWLFDRHGNSFYNAHLSAFSPIARDGAWVRAGDVIGFVGDTGDAQGTPPHLHFEVHPGNGAPVNPIAFLNAWRQGVAVALGLLAGNDHRTAPMSLLSFTDISANSGLAASVLDSVPDTRVRPIEGERVPQPTAKTLKGAIEGPGIARS